MSQIWEFTLWGRVAPVTNVHGGHAQSSHVYVCMYGKVANHVEY